MAMFHAYRPAVVPAALAAALLAGIAACGTQRASSAQQVSSQPATVRSASSQPVAVQSAFSHAIRVDASLGSPPAAYQDSVLAAFHAGRQLPALTAALRGTILASGKAAIARYFGQPQAATELMDLDKAMRMDTSHNIANLGSGVSKITIRNVTVAATSATVDAVVTVWAKSLARQTSTGPWLTTAPVNMMDYTATLTRTSSGSWQVTSLRGDFVPGHGP